MNKKMESAVTIVFLVQKQTHPGILPVEKKARTSCGEVVTMGGDLQPGCLAERLLTLLGQPQINL